MQALAAALEAATRRGITVEPATDRADALPGADAVVVSVEVDRDRRWQLDFEIPRRHGVEHVLGENAGPGGLAHALRTIPLVAGIARDVERLAPDALLLNFTNPEGRICTAFRRHLDQPIIGLCHEVQLARQRFSDLLGRPIECRAAGLNHLTALVAARDATTGDDLTPDLHAAVDALRDEDGETYSFVRYLHDRFGVVIATSDSHAGEYYREAVEHAAPKDFLARQVKLRSFVDGVADAIVAGPDGARAVLRLGGERAAAPDAARRDHRRARADRVGDPPQRRSRARAPGRLRGRGRARSRATGESRAIGPTTCRSRSPRRCGTRSRSSSCSPTPRSSARATPRSKRC